MKPGEVYRFISGQHVVKPKYHLCISVGGGFLFLNSPKSKAFEGDLHIDAADLPFLPATAEGYSVLSCSTVIQMTAAELRKCKAELIGEASRSVLVKLCDFVEDAEFLTEEERELILSGIEDWL